MAGRASPRWRRLTAVGPSPVYPQSGCIDLSVVVSLSIHIVASSFTLGCKHGGRLLAIQWAKFGSCSRGAIAGFGVVIFLPECAFAPSVVLGGVCLLRSIPLKRFYLYGHRPYK